MFLIRKFEEKDVPDCAMCFYESFFDCPLTENDRAFLRDYAQVLAEKCSFTYVAESEGQVVGFIIGHYKKDFDKSLAKTHDAKPHYKAWLRCFSSSRSAAIRCPCRSRRSSMSFIKTQRERQGYAAHLRLRTDGALLAQRFPQRFRNRTLERISQALRRERRKDCARIYRYGRDIHIL